MHNFSDNSITTVRGTSVAPGQLWEVHGRRKVGRDARGQNTAGKEITREMLVMTGVVPEVNMIPLGLVYAYLTSRRIEYQRDADFGISEKESPIGRRIIVELGAPLWLPTSLLVRFLGPLPDGTFQQVREMARHIAYGTPLTTATIHERRGLKITRHSDPRTGFHNTENDIARALGLPPNKVWLPAGFDPLAPAEPPAPEPAPAPSQSQIHLMRPPSACPPSGYYTVVSGGKLFTFRLKTHRRRPGEQVAGCLTGTDDQSGYTYFAYVRGRRNAPIWFPFNNSTYESWITALHVLLDGDYMAAGLAYSQATGRCFRCKRKLINPESIARGYGPECARHLRLA